MTGPKLFVAVAPLVLTWITSATAATVDGETKRWHTIELDFVGPETDETATPNPFTDYRLDVRFVHLDSGREVQVPGFFAADGNAADTSATGGNRWRARFAPPLEGVWQYRATLRTGKDVAIVADPSPFPTVALEKPNGLVTISASDKTAPDFRAEGHLRATGERYLTFSGSGRRFLKAGANSPETLLGYAEFEGTFHDTQSHPIPAPHDPIKLPSLENGLHRYEPHIDDWRDGDPTWQDGRGKGLIGAMNYLAEVGVNSAYFLTMNVNGDGRNVWPWIDPWEHERFDCGKLDQWEIVFEHMQSRGIQMHVVLQETENDHLLDRGETGRTRKLYLREMVARFAHHPALTWNLGEENTQTPQQQTDMARFIESRDAYDHPIVIHNDHWSPKNLRDTFDPLLGKDVIDGTAMQDFHWNDIHATTKHYVNASAAAGQPWFVSLTEMGGANFGLRTDADDPDHDVPRTRGLWGNLMAGGAGVEWYFGWQNNSPQSDLSAEDFRPRESMWRQSKLAVDFFHRYLPFHRMKAADETVSDSSAYVLAEIGQVYAIYLSTGGQTRLDLRRVDGTYSVRWFNPRVGGRLRSSAIDFVRGGQIIATGTPPEDPGKDWLCLIRRVKPHFTAAAGEAIAIEAEHFRNQRRDDVRRWYVQEKGGSLPDLDGAGDATRWVRSNLSAAFTASGETYVRILPDTRQTHDDELIGGKNFAPNRGKMAILDYDVHFPAPGRYYVWARAFSTGTEDNGLHVGIDGRWPDSGKRMQWCEGKHRWTWGCAQRTEAKHCGEPMQIYLDVTESGVHTFSVSMREDGFALDKWLLTTNRDYRPRGEGPPARLHVNDPPEGTF